MTATNSRVNLTTAGIYTIPEAARLLSVSAQRVRNWVQGYSGGLGPIIDNELGLIADKNAISFVNLMEARFIDFFVSRGVRPQSMRLMLSVARDYLKVDRPFAYEAMFRTDGRTVFIETTDRSGDKVLFNLGKNNWAMYPIIVGSLHKDVVFDANGVARWWFPRANIAPSVVADPIRSFGHPVLSDYGVPTHALFNALQVEGESFESVAHWYDVPVSAVQEAVQFEVSLLH